MANVKITGLTQATNAELTDDALAYVVTDPNGSPASRKSTLARLGLPPISFLEEWEDYYGFALNQNGDFTTGQSFVPRRVGQVCTGIRVYWNSATATTLTLSLWPTGGGGLLASGTVASSSAGYKSVTFGTPVALTKSNSYVAAVWDGVKQAPELNPSGKPTTAAIAQGAIFRDFVILGWGYYAPLNASPVSVYVNNFYAVEPLIEG